MQKGPLELTVPRCSRMANLELDLWRLGKTSWKSAEIQNSVETIKLVLFTAVGCSDLAPPSDSAWLKRVDDQITVGCYMSRQSWQLNCVNGVWTGTVGVCSQMDDNVLCEYSIR